MRTIKGRQVISAEREALIKKNPGYIWYSDPRIKTNPVVTDRLIRDLGVKTIKVKNYKLVHKSILQVIAKHLELKETTVAPYVLAKRLNRGLTTLLRDLERMGIVPIDSPYMKGERVLISDIERLIQ